MAPSNLFMTGATGYIGGSILVSILDKYPDLHVTALLRASNPDFEKAYPTVSVVQGTFDDAAVIEQTAFEADIVLHAGDIDHVGCAKAIISGLKRRSLPSFLIHLTGTGCISDERSSSWDGSLSSRIWNDVNDIDEIHNLPDKAKHHVIDRWIMDLTATTNGLVKTACLCPPDIYGPGRGKVGSHRSFLIPIYIDHLLAGKPAFYLGKGENMRAVTHIDDVVSLFILVLGEAISGGGKAQWGKEGFYFGVADEIPWKKAAEKINEIGLRDGWLKKGSMAASWSEKQVADLLPQMPGIALYLWGSNSRAESERAKALGWKVQGPGFWEVLESDVQAVVSKAG